MPVQQVLNDQHVPVKIWTNDVDDRSKEQLTNIAGLPFAPMATQIPPPMATSNSPT